jgi:glycosyltransferase involved in cell wall biosynthesis
MKDPISVTLVVGAAPYQKTLAAKLNSVGMLRQLIEVVPQLDIREPDGEGNLELVKSFSGFALLKRVVWGMWRRFPKQVQPRPPMTMNAWLADRLIANAIAECRIFHSCTAICLASLRVAKQRGAITLVESASCHPQDWRKVELEESAHFGARGRDESEGHSGRILRRMEQEFVECDRIVVPSRIAQESFAEYGYSAKTVLVQTGVDAEFFSPGAADARAVARETFRVCYVGRVEFAKGVGYLLEAWKRLGLQGAELLLVGEVKPQMQSFLKSYQNCGVRLAGVLPSSEVARCYRESNLFVMPSLNEGLAQVLLEAMASGLPAVATDRTGANDCIAHGNEGLIVPARDAGALASAIQWCYEHREESVAMGKAARARIEREFTLEHYNARVIQMYRGLV